MKKRYEKPTCKVIMLQRRTQLLTQSGDQWLNYAPGQPTDEMNRLA